MVRRGLRFPGVVLLIPALACATGSSRQVTEEGEPGVTGDVVAPQVLILVGVVPVQPVAVFELVCREPIDRMGGGGAHLRAGDVTAAFRLQNEQADSDEERHPGCHTEAHSPSH